MRLLAIDTSQAACSVALWQGETLWAHRYVPMPKGHAEALIPMIEEVRLETGFSFEDLDAFAVTVGPGTFTGLRVGLATARGFAVASGKPCIGITSLEAITHPARLEASAGEIIAASFDARRNEIYLQCFAGDGTALTEAALVSLDDVNAHVPMGKVLFVGTGSSLLRAALTHEGRLADAAPLPDARHVAALAVTRSLDNLSAPSPLYLRAPDAKLPSNPLIPIPQSGRP